MVFFNSFNVFFLNFSTQSHAESFRNYVKKSFLDPKCLEFDEKASFWTYMELPRPVQEDRSLSAKQIFLFCSPEITPFQILSTNLSFFYKIRLFIKQIHELLAKSNILLSKFIIFKIHTREIHKWNIFWIHTYIYIYMWKIKNV